MNDDKIPTISFYCISNVLFNVSPKGKVLLCVGPSCQGIQIHVSPRSAYILSQQTYLVVELVLVDVPLHRSLCKSSLVKR